MGQLLEKGSNRNELMLCHCLKTADADEEIRFNLGGSSQAV